ncbi:MAG: DUF29 domain-containing protein [Candidatus Competibacteraceae bacterium]|nr:DUF29 domain-containing protein [Candidatus Competibacteraceae bacterium]
MAQIAETEAPEAASLYERDFHAWAQGQAALARAGHSDALDLENLAEELEGMARSDRRAMESRLEVLLMHLLKWRRYQPNPRSVPVAGAARSVPNATRSTCCASKALRWRLRPSYRGLAGFKTWRWMPWSKPSTSG